MKNLFLVGLLLIIAISCDKETIEKPPIEGIWVETIYKSDTLIFDSGAELFDLNRGGENLTLQARSRPYAYELGKDSISVSWLFSSATFGSLKYYFDLNEEKEQMKIGNFYVDSLGVNEILIFSRIN